MTYIVQQDYKEFTGGELDSADFPFLLERAEEIVEEMTMYRLNSETFPKMPEKTQERIKKAVCAQIEYLDANGGADMDNGVDLMSAGLGKFSYTKASGANGSQTQPIYAPRALRILAPTGLLYKGGGYY